MIFRSIKWSLQLWHGLILLLVLTGFGYTAFELQRTRELRRIDQELQDRLTALFGPMRAGAPGPGVGRRPMRNPEDRMRPVRPERRPELPDELPPNFDRTIVEPSEPGTVYHVIWRRDDSVRSFNVPEGLTRPQAGDASGPRTRGTVREFVRFTPRGDVIVVGRSIEPELFELRKLSLLLLGSGATILALGLAGGWFVATRAMRPIESITSTALKISSGDLSQRIAHEESESELGRLVSVLNSTFARLEAAFSDQVRFTTDVSHELRTPVSVIVSQTQMALARERSAPEYRETVEACARAAQRMRGLIESLMQLARLDAGQEPLKEQSIDLATVAAECIALLNPLAEQRGLKLIAQLTPVTCRGDSERLGQVVVNLLTNAIHYTPENGHVTISTSRENDFAILRVSDSGLGVPAEDLPHIFDRFYRVEKSRSREKGGSGLGLAISKAIVSAHSGSIEVANNPGGGAAFTVRIPEQL